MATVNLGRIKPVFRGAYSGSTAYVVDDIVTHGNETFICIQAHGAGTQATSQTAYWTKLAAKGTDGTDVGTTITTQGDILYRDGSGLARLAAGTSGQFLKTQGSGANPTWATLSSDYVLISTTNQTSSVASVSFDGFSDTYHSFQIHFANVIPASNGVRFEGRYRRSNADVTSSNYKSIAGGGEVASGSQNNGQAGGGFSSNLIRLQTGNLLGNNTSYGGISGFITLHDARATGTGKYKMGTGIACYNRSDDAVWIYNSLGFVDFSSTDALSGFTFFMDSGNIASGKFKLYGLK